MEDLKLRIKTLEDEITQKNEELNYLKTLSYYN
jgi:chaperonin cofactor prefoldin